MLRAHRENARKFARKGGTYTPPATSTSTHISVLGRRKYTSVSGSDVQQPPGPLLRFKRQRLTKQQLLQLQHADTALDSAHMNNVMNQEDLSTLAELQKEIAGESAASHMDNGDSLDFKLPPDFILDGENEGDDCEDEGEDEDSAWEDVIEHVGITAKSTWSNRILNDHHAWMAELPALCDAYLHYKAKLDEPFTPGQPADDISTISIACIDITGDSIKTFTHSPSTSLNVTLLLNGYLGPTYERPNVAISLLVLELFTTMHRRAPSTSTQAAAKMLCDLRNVPYQPYSRVQLSAALDAYQMIQREVKRRLNVTMHQTLPDLRIRTSCAACTYKLMNEPKLRYSMLVTCDGNDSLKRCAAAGTADQRHFESDYFISRTEVDRFKREVPARARKQGDEASVCEKRWKNAKVDNNPDKKTKTMYHETGVFVCSCRHGFILTACDMVQSGEQAKYGLVVIEKLIDILGDDIMMGYDIGCAFKGTAERSPLVGPRVKVSRFDMCIGSFHGSAHNRRCQLKFHPHNIAGTGLTDFENCETIFSSSNRIAGSTRLSSAFHRHQRINSHFDGWDDDAHLNLGALLRSKYTSALKERDAAEATMAQIGLTIPTSDLDTYFEMEYEYIDAMRAPPPEDLIAVEYLDLLERLESKEKEYNACRNASFVAVEGSSTTDLRRSALLSGRIESRRRTTMDQLHALQDEVEHFEEKHKIFPRWTQFNLDWINADKIRQRQHYQQCIDDLERLVVQRLFELSRVGLSNTGYKLRQHIMKALIARSKAVKTAITRYNKAASQLHPPSPTITWEMVANSQILSDFDLLRGSRETILEQDWAKPKNRQLVGVWHRLQRAEEEIEWLNIEIRRVRTMIHDERKELPVLVAQIAQSNKGLAWAANHYITRRLKINALIDKQLGLLVSQPGFTGTRDLGIRISKHQDELLQDQTCNPQLIDEAVSSNSVNDPSREVFAETQGVELDVVDLDEDAISEQLGQWHLALACVDSDIL